MNFGIILTQFYINFLRKDNQIDVLNVSFNAWDSQISSCTSLQFSFTVSLNTDMRLPEWRFLIDFDI